MEIKIDFRLVEVAADLFALGEHLEMIERQMSHIEEEELRRLKEYLQKNGLTQEDPDGDMAVQEYLNRVSITLPRFFRGPFLVSLYAVYESAVTEIARLMQKSMSLSISIDDLRGDFLDRAKKYYNHVVKLDLYASNMIWQNILMLSELRNAVAHSNGRLDMLNRTSRKRILDLGSKSIGISNYYGYLVIEADLMAKLFETVRDSLNDLVERYKAWDDAKSST